MKNAKYWVFGAAFIALLIGFSTQSARSVYSSPVSVTNTPLPVQQQGPVDTSGSNINVTNTPTVNLAGGTSVGITGNSANSPLITSDADNPARQPVSVYFSRYAPAGNTQTACGGGAAEARIYTVPAGKVLVLEHFNAYGLGGAVGQSPSLMLQDRSYLMTEGGRSGWYPTRPVIFVDQMTRMYLQPNQGLWVCIYRQEATDPFSVSGYVDGYLVNAP